ncbi:hypothetical protein ACLOJK_019092 [Asimina triloba]
MALGGAGRSWPTIAGVLDLAKGLFFICSSCYCSDRLRDGFHAAWNGFCLDSALKPAGLFGCGWPRRTRKLLAGRWVLNRQDLTTVDGRLWHKTLDQRDGCSNGAGHGCDDDLGISQPIAAGLLPSSCCPGGPRLLKMRIYSDEIAGRAKGGRESYCRRWATDLDLLIGGRHAPIAAP